MKNLLCYRWYNCGCCNAFMRLNCQCLVQFSHIQGLVHPKMENSLSIYSGACCRWGLVLKHKKTTEKETQDGSGAIHVTGIPEIPSWFEKMFFMTSTHSLPYIPTSDGVHKNTFSFYPETWFISDELYRAILFCLYVLLTPKQIMTEFSFLIELFL